MQNNSNPNQMYVARQSVLEAKHVNQLNWWQKQVRQLFKIEPVNYFIYVIEIEAANEQMLPNSIVMDDHGVTYIVTAKVRSFKYRITNVKPISYCRKIENLIILGQAHIENSKQQ